jgi:hypothetical protein
MATSVLPAIGIEGEASFPTPEMEGDPDGELVSVAIER